MTIMTNLSIIVNDGSPVRVVVDQPVGEVVQVFSDGGHWREKPNLTSVPPGADFPDMSLDTVRVEYVIRDGYTYTYVSCGVKRSKRL